MKNLIIFLLLFPLFGFGQPKSQLVNSYIEENFNLPYDTIKQINPYHSAQAIIHPKALVSSNLDFYEEYKMLLDSFYLFYFNYQSDTLTVIREYYEYDNHGAKTLFAKYVPCEYCVEGTHKIESLYDENNRLSMDMSFYWDYTLRQWFNGRKDAYIYDLDGSLVSMVSYWWDVDNGLWKDPWKTVNSYDEHGNILSEISSRYDANTGIWIGTSKQEYSYLNKKRTMHLFCQWNEGISQWINRSKEESEFDIKGNEIIRSHYYWEELDNHWVNNAKVIKTYSSEGKMTNNTQFRWDDSTSQWVEVHKDDYTFDSNKNEILKISWDWDASSNQWRGDFKIESMYNDKGLLTSRITNRWNLNNSNEWNLRSKDDFEYDRDENITTITTYSWRLADKVWFMSTKSNYYYSLHDLSNGVDINENQRVRIYPNPSQETFTIEINDRSLTHCQLFNSNGQLIQTLFVEMGVNYFNISHLKQGVYLLKIKFEGGVVVKKLIKK